MPRVVGMVRSVTGERPTIIEMGGKKITLTEA